MAVPGARAGANIRAIRQRLAEASARAADGARPRPQFTPTYGVRLDDAEAATPPATVAPEQVPVAVESPTPAVVPQAATPAAKPVEIVQQGKQFVVIGEGGVELGVAKKGRGGQYTMADGTVLELGDDGASVVVVKEADPGDLTTSAAEGSDNLAASSVEIAEEGAPPSPPKSGLTPNKKKVDQNAELAQRLFQYGADAPQEPISQGALRRDYNKFSKLPPEEQARAIGEVADAGEFRRRLGVVAEIAGEDPQFRAAKQVDEAAQAVDNAAQPTPRQSPVPSAQDLAAARQLFAESMPQGDWNALTRVFGSLPPEQRAAVLERLSATGGADFQARNPSQAVQKATRDAADPSASYGFVRQMLDPNSAEPVFVPNQVAQVLSPANDVDQLLLDIDTAKRTGESERAASLSAQLREGIAPTDGSPPKFTSDQVNEARTRFMLRRQVETELRNAIIGTDELYRDAQSGLLNASRPQPQPNVIPQGARTPEISPVVEGEPPAAPPGADATAALREREEQAATNAPLGGLTMPERLALMGLDPNDPQAARQLPLWLKGRDRGDSLESRSMGSRAGELTSNDEAAIEQAEALKEAIKEAQYELRLAQIGLRSGRATSTAEDVAAMQDTLRNLLAMEDKMFPPRLINEATGQVQAVPAAMLRDPSRVPAGFVIERGRRAMADSWLNRAGQADTYDGLIATAVGMRPRGAENLTRANAGMNPFDAAAIRDEAIEMFGEDAAQLMDTEFDPNWSVDPRELSQPSAPLKDNALGGTQQMSRERAAVRSLFNGPNPLTLINPRTGKNFTAAEVVAETMSRNRMFTNLDSANYEMARDRLTQLVEREFKVPDPVPATPDPAAPASAPAAGPGTTQDPASVPAIDGRQNAAGTPPERPAGTDFSQPATVLSPEERKLLDSAVEIEDPDVIDKPDDPAAAAAAGGNRRTVMSVGEVLDAARSEGEEFTPQQVEALWRKWFSQQKPRSVSLPDGTIWEMGVRPGMTFEEWAAETLDGKGLRGRVPSADGRSSRKVKVIGVDGGEVVDAADDAAGATPAARPAPEANRGSAADDAEVIDAPDDPAAPRNAADAADAPAATRAADEAGDTTPTPSSQQGGTTPPPKKKGWITPGRVAGALVGGGVLASFYASKLGQPQADGPIDIPGGPGGEGRRPYIPVGLDVAPGAAAGGGGSAEEDAIQRALDRLRGSRKGSSMPAYNTMFNYTYRS